MRCQICRGKYYKTLAVGSIRTKYCEAHFRKAAQILLPNKYPNKCRSCGYRWVSYSGCGTGRCPSCRARYPEEVVL